MAIISVFSNLPNGITSIFIESVLYNYIFTFFIICRQELCDRATKSHNEKFNDDLKCDRHFRFDNHILYKQRAQL